MEKRNRRDHCFPLAAGLEKVRKRSLRGEKNPSKPLLVAFVQKHPPWPHPGDPYKYSFFNGLAAKQEATRTPGFSFHCKH